MIMRTTVAAFVLAVTAVVASATAASAHGQDGAPEHRVTGWGQDFPDATTNGWGADWAGGAA